MTKYFKTPLGRLRLIAILEGITLLCMVFITLPLRVNCRVNTFSKLRFAVENNWKFKEMTWKDLIACIIPFGTFYIDYKILGNIKS